MLQRLQRHATAIVCGTALIFSCAVWPTAAQSPASAAGKRPLGYEAFDAWWSIQGTTLSRNGEWLAYALTAQALDGQLVVRNLRTGQEFKHPRGTSPSFTPDGKFLVFSIVPTKAEDEKEEQANRARGGGEGEGREGQAAGGRGGQRSQPRNSAGIPPTWRSAPGTRRRSRSSSASTSPTDAQNKSNTRRMEYFLQKFFLANKISGKK